MNAFENPPQPPPLAATQQISADERAFALFNDSPMAIAITSADGVIQEANPAFATLSGYAASELVGVSIDAFSDPDDTPSWSSRLQQLVSGGAPGDACEIEKRFVRCDGSRRWAHAHVRLLRGLGEGPDHCVAHITDITAQRVAQESAQRTVELYRLAESAFKVALYDYDPKGLTVTFSNGLTASFGYRPDDVEGADWWNDKIHPDDRQEVRRLMKQAAEAATEFVAEYRFRRADGSYAYVWDSSVMLRDPKGEVRRAVGALVDITERKRQEDALSKANGQLEDSMRALQAQSREIALLGELGEVLHAALSEQEAYEIIADVAPRLFPAHAGMIAITNASRDVVEVMASWAVATANDHFAPLDCWALRRGRLHSVSQSEAGLICRHVNPAPAFGYFCVPMMARGEALGVVHLTSLVENGGGDTAEPLAVAFAEHVAMSLANLRLRETLQHQSVRDPLTGLFNRRHMEESLARELSRSRRTERPLSVLMLDIDHFKRFNDTFGHESGDAVLKGIGEYLRAQTRGEDIACRYGGEELTVILPDTARGDAVRRAQQLLEGIRSLTIPMRSAALEPVTASIGVSEFPADAGTAEDLLRLADDALYRAKRAGRDQVQAAGDD